MAYSTEYETGVTQTHKEGGVMCKEREIFDGGLFPEVHGIRSSPDPVHILRGDPSLEGLDLVKILEEQELLGDGTAPQCTNVVQVVFRTPDGQEVVTAMGLGQWLAITGARGKENLPAYLRELLEWDGSYHVAAHQGLVQMVTELRERTADLEDDLETLWEEEEGKSLPHIQPGDDAAFETMMRRKKAQDRWGEELSERTKARRAAEEMRRQQRIAEQAQSKTAPTDGTPPPVL